LRTLSPLSSPVQEEGRRLNDPSAEGSLVVEMSSTAAATAVPHVRYNAEGLRSTDGSTRQYQYNARGEREYLTVIETYGGYISFNVDATSDVCWYLGAPL